MVFSKRLPASNTSRHCISEEGTISRITPTFANSLLLEFLDYRSTKKDACAPQGRFASITCHREYALAQHWSNKFLRFRESNFRCSAATRA
jgi:hypothetical protein